MYIERASVVEKHAQRLLNHQQNPASTGHKMFTLRKLEGEWWAVFLENPNNENDRYMVTSPLDKKDQAIGFLREFNRILNQE